MSLAGGPLKVLTMALLVVQLCLSVSGPVYVVDYLSSDESGHSADVCAHTDADSGHESHDGHGWIPHCHELDAPCDTASCPVLEHQAVIGGLTSSYAGALLPGYGAPIDMPPEIRV